MGLSPLLPHPPHPTAFLGGLRAKAQTLSRPPDPVLQHGATWGW